MTNGRVVRGIVFMAIPIFAICACFACGGDSVSRGEPAAGADTKPPAGHVIAPERRLKDYKEHLKYPPFNRPADADTPDLDNWPGYGGRRIDDVRILSFKGHAVRKGSLYIAFQVDAKQAGRYTFDALLRHSSGKKVAVSSLTRDLKPGTQTLEFLFYGKIMRDAKVSGVFELRGINGQRVLSDHELDLMGRAELKKSPEGVLRPLRTTYTTGSLKNFTSKDWQSAAKQDHLDRIRKEIKDK